MNLARAVRTLHRQQWVPRPLETVFDFFEHPENLTLITPPYSFRDVQVIGPYRRWDHCHRFRREEGGTAIEDLVVYEPPLGPLGGLLDVLVIRRQLAAIFEYRRQRIDALVGAGAAASRG